MKIYHPKKVTHAAIELVDTPGLSRTHEGNAARMAMIREAGCLVFVVAAFDDTNPVADLRSFDEDLVLADMEIVTNRIAARRGVSSRSRCPARNTSSWSTSTAR